MSWSSPLKVGVFLAESGVQLLDVAPVDMLGMLQKDYLQAISQVVNLPQLASKGFDIEYYFVNETGQSPNPMTGGFKVEVTHSITTCPPLDILLIGGPRPDYRPSPAVQQFLQTQYSHVRALLLVCLGYIPALFSGILDGKSATAPQALIPLLKNEAPGVTWVEKRWVRDGKVWTSGAVLNGQEMMASFMKEEFKEMGEVVEMVLSMSDVAVRGESY
ncbi:MAG: hypothetical protein LQ338_003325 [Usnochroma carphineum]|nr:MAG: hypothetical protein LQ338_003325 [Usnochroma carphineum]